MQEARRAARAVERGRIAGLGGSPDLPDWVAVVDLAAAVLSGQGKDIEAAAALLEGAVRTDGLAGLASAADVLAGLVSRYWGQLYPSAGPNEDVATECLRPLAGLGKVALLAPVRLIPLFPLPDGSAATLGTFEAAAAIDSLPEDTRERRISDGALDTAALKARAAAYPGELALRAEVARRALEAWTRLEAAMLAVAGERKPSTSDVHEALQQIAGLSASLAPSEAHPDPVVEETVEHEPLRASPQPAAGAIASREDALRRLAQVAAWFRQTEPHSPLSYTLDDTVRRGRLSWPDLLAEIVADYGERARILTALGIRPPPETIE